MLGATLSVWSTWLQVRRLWLAGTSALTAPVDVTHSTAQLQRQRLPQRLHRLEPPMSPSPTTPLKTGSSHDGILRTGISERHWRKSHYTYSSELTNSTHADNIVMIFCPVNIDLCNKIVPRFVEMFPRWPVAPHRMFCVLEEMSCNRAAERISWALVKQCQRAPIFK